MGILVIALGFAVLFQFIILRTKWNRGNYADVGVDVIMLALLNGVFGGSILGVISATAGSTLISLYLIWYPIKLLNPQQEAKLKEAGVSYSKATKHTKPSQIFAERFDGLFD